MKPIRYSSLFTAMATALLFISVFYASCTKDPDPAETDTKCENVNCNNGSCLQGQCACNIGWEGFACDIKSVQRYFGNWSAIETITYSLDTGSVGDTFSYVFSILPNGDDVLSFKIAGLMGSDDTITATLGNPQSHAYASREYYFVNQNMTNVNANVPLVYIPAGGGRITSSGSLMDSMAYNRRYEYIVGMDTTYRKDTVMIVTQKI